MNRGGQNAPVLHAEGVNINDARLVVTQNVVELHVEAERLLLVDVALSLHVLQLVCHRLHVVLHLLHLGAGRTGSYR